MEVARKYCEKGFIKLESYIKFEKCSFRKVNRNLIYQMDKKHLEQFKKYWKAHLATLVGVLPKFEEVVDDVLAYRDKIFN